MKPWEETWDQTSDIKTPEARQLAIAAPEMARALLGLVDEAFCIDACGNGGEDPEECSPRCVEVRDALHKAGVLTP